MTKQQAKVARAANAMLWLWHEVIKSGDPWYRLDARQAYRDCLHIMVCQGLIEDYDVVRCEVKIKGVWTDARTMLEI